MLFVPPLPLGLRLLLVSLLLICFLSFSDAACTQLDQTSLLSFSQSFSQLNWSANSQSQQVNCCSWFGIACDVNDRVTAVSLPSLGLRGLISPSILNLTNLSHIDLSHNFLSGPLPDCFFLLLNRLQVIDLSYNHLSGSLPDNDSLPLSIQSLDLSSNHFYGRIQPSLFRVNLVLLTLATTHS